MKKIIILFSLSVIFLETTAQDNKYLVKLAKAHKDFSFRNEPPKGFTKGLEAEMPEGLKTTARFILQTITTKNKLGNIEYLKLPDDVTLKNIYIIGEIRQSFEKENGKDPVLISDSLKNTDIPRNELVDNYYGFLFTGMGNKNQPFDFSKYNFKLSDYNLSNDTEKGIFFLKCMNLCGTVIWGYINIANPRNTKEALKYIKNYPQFNGMEYYQYTDFFFPDFEMKILADKPKQSYKSYYLNKYYETLLSHLLCLNKEGGSEKEKQDLMLGSILKENSLYKYTEYKDILEQIFEEKK